MSTEMVVLIIVLVPVLSAVGAVHLLGSTLRDQDKRSKSDD